ncbi:OmpH family outer membrane protein [Aliivibrio sp.]|uniref:OmpH family outer membrane protein n=1 Tax=Aliivibrio sp. TaxID=1872443 RepID=UPI003D2F1022
MNKVMKAASIGLVILSSSMFADAAEAAQKVGYVNIAKIAQSMPQRESITTQLRAEFKDRIDAARELKEKIVAKEAKLKRDGELLGQSGAVKLQREIASLKSGLKLDAEALNEDTRKRQAEEQKKLMSLIQKTVEKVAKAEGYDMVVEARSLMFATPEDDLSAKVLAAAK